MLPGWGAMRLLRVERELGLAGAMAVSTSLGLAIWIAPLAAAFAAGLPLGAPLAVVLGAGVLLCLAAVTRPLLFERVGATGGNLCVLRHPLPDRHRPMRPSMKGTPSSTATSG